jgi:hypothetical protein
MKRLKKIALLISGGFVVFAPPGTLIVIALLIAPWVGGIPAIVAAIVGLCSLGAWMIVRTRRERKDRGAPGSR